jgi:hypothetical protein
LNESSDQKADFVQLLERNKTLPLEKDAWDQLSEPERYLISRKLTHDDGQATRDAFNLLVTVRNNDGGLDQNATADRIETVSNFLTAAGACEHGRIWNQIRTIEAVGRSELACHGLREAGLPERAGGRRLCSESPQGAS